MAVLGCLFRNGDLTVGELAAHERIQPPSMTRIVNCPRGGRLRRTTAPRDRRPPGRGRRSPSRAARRSWPTAPAATPGWPAACASSPPTSATSSAGPRRSWSASPPPTDHDCSTTESCLEPHLPRPAQPQLPALRARQRGVQHRHLDAARRAGLAGAAASPTAAAPPSASPPACSSCRCCSSRRTPASIADRFPKRRLLQLTQLTMAVASLVLGVLAVTGRGRGLARLRDRLPLRHRLGLRRARPPVVRLRDGRPRRPHQRRRPQLRHVQHRPHHRPGAWPA